MREGRGERREEKRVEEKKYRIEGRGERVEERR